MQRPEFDVWYLNVLLAFKNLSLALASLSLSLSPSLRVYCVIVQVKRQLGLLVLTFCLVWDTVCYC